VIPQATAWRAGTIVVALLLAWRIITVNAVLYTDDGRPRLIAPAGDAVEPGLAALLADNPAEVAALLVLAQERERRGDIAGATRAYESAVRIAPIDRDTLVMSSGFFLRQKRGADALLQLDRLVENHGEFDKVFPVFAQQLAAREPGMQAIAARNPAWLGAFIVDGCRRGSDPLLLAPLLQRRAAAGKAQGPEVDCVTARLRAAGKWDVAYQVWLNTLARERLAEVGNVFNGSFEYEPSNTGFDWRIAAGSERDLGHAVAFATADSGSGKRALRVTYTGRRQSAPAIEEYLAVPPGRYVLSGSVRLDQFTSVRGLQWTLRCAGNEGGAGRALASTERFVGGNEWRAFDTPVSIPADCAGQVLQLEPVGLGEGTTYVAGSAWFDDLRLTRAR